MKRWKKSEVALLRRLKPTNTNKQLAEIFGTTPSAVAQKCNEIGIKRGSQPNAIHLSHQQEVWMRTNFPQISNAICALILGISIRSVVRQARRLGLQKTPQFVKEAQAYTAKKARDSHLRNGTYPPRGYYSPNLQKGKPYQFGSCGT